MNKKTLLVAIVSLLMLTAFIPGISAFVARQDHLIIATICEPQTVDPAWLYDTASAELGMNVYDTLVSFAVDRTLSPEEQGQTNVFVRSLATNWWTNQPPHPDAPAGTNNTWYFRIRGTSGEYYTEGSLFQSADPDGILSPTDIIAHARGYIVIGDVKEIECRWEDDLIYSYVTIFVVDVERGPEDWEGEEIIVKHIGGGIDGVGLWQSDQAYFTVGETVRVYLQGELPVFTVIGGPEGKVSLDSELSSIEEYTAAGYKLCWYDPEGTWHYSSERPGPDWYGPLRWDIPAGGVHYKINPAGSTGEGIPEATFINYVKKSYQTWEDAPSSAIDYMYLGTTTKTWDNSMNDRVNIFCWKDLENQAFTLGVCRGYFTYTTGDYDSLRNTDCDVLLNTNAHYDWSAAPTCPSDKLDVQNVGTHEVGHVCGLGDLYDDEDAEMTMFGGASSGEIKKRDLNWGDLQGVCVLYPWLVFHPWTDPNTGEEHPADKLTAEDIEYSFERLMVMDRTGGPAWMIYEPLLGVYHADLDWPEESGNSIDTAVESNSTHVWFNLAMPYPPFMQILCGSWASIVNKAFCVAHGCWDGDWTNWKVYHDPIYSPLDFPNPVMCGTGPYMLDYWEKGVEWSIVWFPDHWQGWPAPLPCQGSLYTEGWLKRVTEKFIPEWSTRKMMFLAGDVDFVYVPRINIPELIPDWPAEQGYVPGIRCFKDLPMLALDAMFFNFDVSTDSLYLGPGFNQATPYAMGEDRMRVDMFSDINVRKGFACAFDYDTYIKDVYLGEATQPATPVVDTLPYHNPVQPGYDYNLVEARLHLEAAWGGDLWTNGFRLTLAYNKGNVARRIASEMIRDAIESLNPKFHIDIAMVPWPQYLDELVSFKLPLFINGWLADYPDPHDFVHPFMHSQGALAQFQSYSNPIVDAWVEEGIATPYGLARRAIYYTLQEIYHEDCPSVPLAQPEGRHWERDWVMGWYYNPIYGGSHAVGVESTAPADPVLYFYHLWKGYRGDNDRDYDVDLDDLYLVLWWYGSPVPPAPPEYDWDKDGEIDLDDLYDVLVNYGK